MRPIIYGPDGRPANEKPACGFHQPETTPSPKANTDHDAALMRTGNRTGAQKPYVAPEQN
jgi:hypothetical protein